VDKQDKIKNSIKLDVKYDILDEVTTLDKIQLDIKGENTDIIKVN
jgi:hypothetical protein